MENKIVDMKSHDRQVNISAYQIIFILLICRCQSFMISVDLRRVLQVDTSNIYISMIISLVSVFLIYIPAIILLKKFQYINIIDISKKMFPKLGNVISVLFSLYFLLMAIAHVANTNFFMISYIYYDASPFLIVGIILVAVYALYLGAEAIFRSGTIMFVMFFVLNVVVFVLLMTTYNTHNLGPIVLEKTEEIFQDSKLLSFSAELVAFLVLAEYTKQKTVLTYSGYQIVIFVMQLLLILTITLSMGRYTNTNIFPLYTISSMIEISILDRLESIYIVLDTMLSVIKTAVYLFLSYKCVESFVKRRFFMPLVILFGVVCVMAAVFIFYNITVLKSLLAFVNSPVVILFFVVFLPIGLLIANKVKTSVKQKKLMATR